MVQVLFDIALVGVCGAAVVVSWQAKVACADAAKLAREAAVLASELEASLVITYEWKKAM